MAQPTLHDVHIDSALTDISVAYIQDNENFIADKVFPVVPVVHKSDVYYVFDKGDFLRDDVQPVADGEESAGGGFNLTTQNYSCATYGYHKDVGDQVRANQDPAVDIDTTTVKWLMQKHLIARDRKFASKYLTTGVWGTDVTGTAGGSPGSSTPAQWNDDANSDPFTDIQQGITTILQNTGMMPNTMVLGYQVFAALKKHPLVIDRIKYTMGAESKNITESLIAAAFDIPRIVVSKSVYNSAAEGLTGSYAFTTGKVAWLGHVAPSPGLMVPSAGYIFPWQGLTGLNSMGVVVWQERLPGRGRNTIRTDSLVAYDLQIVSKDLGYYFTSIVS